MLLLYHVTILKRKPLFCQFCRRTLPRFPFVSTSFPPRSHSQLSYTPYKRARWTFLIQFCVGRWYTIVSGSQLSYTPR